MAVPDINMNEIVWDSATLYYGNATVEIILPTEAI